MDCHVAYRNIIIAGPGADVVISTLLTCQTTLCVSLGSMEPTLAAIGWY